MRILDSRHRLVGTLETLLRFSSEEDVRSSTWNVVAKFDDFDMDDPVSHLSSLFDGGIHSIRSKKMGRAKLSVMTMRNDVSFDTKSTSRCELRSRLETQIDSKSQEVFSRTRSQR